MITQFPLSDADGPTWDELVDSGGGEISLTASQAKRIFLVTGANAASDVDFLVENQIATGAYGTYLLNDKTLMLDDYKIDAASPTDSTLWIVTLDYRFKVSDFQILGDTTGGTKTVFQALDEGDYYALQDEDQELPDFKGLIGVDGQDVKGVQVPDPKREFSVVIRNEYASIPSDYFDTIEQLTGHTNESPLFIDWEDQEYSYDTEELLFLGMVDKQQGSIGSSSFEITLKFSVQRTQTMPNIANSFDINSDITKIGWRYAWVYSQNTTVNGFRVPQPQVLVINQVIEPMDLTPIGIFS